MLNILLLLLFITLCATTKQNNNFPSLSSKVNAVALTYKNTHFTDAASNGLNISQISGFYSGQTQSDRYNCLPVL